MGRVDIERNLREIVEEWFEQELPQDILPRDITYSIADEIQAIIGPRRAGKTYFMYQIIMDLLQNRYSRRDLVYIDFEDPRLTGFRGQDLGLFLKIIREYFNWKPILFLDEVQNISGWSKFVRTLHSKGFKIFISGSSSKLLSKEIASELRGRCKSIKVFTFSFREYLKAKNIDISTTTYLSKSSIRNHLRTYLLVGGYPRVVLSEDTSLLRDYLDTIFYRDIVERHRIRDITSLRLFQKTLLSSLGALLSINKVYNEFKSLGIKKSKKTLIEYLRYFIEAFFIVPVRKIGRYIEALRQPIKIYPIDTGFLNLTPHKSSFSIRMESIVAIELYKKYGDQVYYWRDYSHREVDFVVTDGFTPLELIQVTHELRYDDKAQYKREVESLLRASRQLQCSNLKIITWEQEDLIKVGNREIKIIPLWKWLLNITT